MFIKTQTLTLVKITILVILSLDVQMKRNTSNQGAATIQTALSNSDASKSDSPKTQIFKPFTIFQFFELTNPEICKGILVTQVDVAKLWVDEEFLQFSKNLAPKDVKPKLNDYLDELVANQIERLEAHLKGLKKNIMDNFEKSETEFFKTMGNNYISEFESLWKLTLTGKNCDTNKQKLLELLSKIESISFKKDLLNRLFTGEKEIAIDYFLENSVCKKLIVEELLKGTDFPRVSSEWKDPYFTKAKTFINENFKVDYKSKINYLEFLDFYTLNSRDPKSTDFLVVNKKFFDFDIYDFLFENYTPKQLKLYIILYKIINLHRLTYKGERANQINDFEGFLDKHNFSEDDKDYYLLIKLIFYFFKSQVKSELNYSFNKDSKKNSDLINKLIEDIPQMRKYVSIVNKDLSLTLDINEFKKIIGESKGETLYKNIEQYFDGLIAQGEYKGDFQDFPFYLEELSIGDDKTMLRKNEIEDKVLLYVFSYFMENKKIDFNKQKSLDVILKQFLSVEKTSSFLLLQRIMTILSNTENNYVLFFSRMIEFFKNKTVIASLLSTGEKLVDDSKEIHRGYCKDLILDFSLFNGENLKFCSKISQPEFPKFEMKFFENFIKLMSFIKVFDFYNNADAVSVQLFIIIYKYINMSKSNYHIESLDNDLSHELNKYLKSTSSRSEYGDITPDYFQYRDIMRLFNLRNVGLVSSDLECINFDQINFTKLKIIIDYFQKATNSEQVITFLGQAYNYYLNKKTNFHFNNIYLIVKADQIRRKILNPEERNKEINSILTSTNNFKKEDFEKTSDFHNVKTSRNAAFFFYLEYADYYKYPQFSDMMKILQDDLKKLANEEKLYFFGSRIFKFFTTKEEVLKFEKKEFSLDRISFNLKKKIYPYLNDFRSKKLQSNSLLRSFLAAENFQTLYEIKAIDEIYKENLFEEVIENILYLFRRNNHLDSMQNFYNQMYPIFDGSLTLHSNQDNVYLFNYYLVSKFFSTTHLPRNLNLKLNSELQNFVDNYFINYYQNLKNKTPDNESVFNVKNLFLTSKNILLKIFPTKNFFIKEMPYKDQLDVITFIYFSYFSDFKKEDLYNKVDIPDKTKLNKYFLDEIQKLELQKGVLDYKYKLYLEEENRNIFYPICKFEEFDIILRSGDILLNQEILDSIKNHCLLETEVEILNNNAYQLLKPLRDHHERFYTKPQVTEITRIMFNSIVQEVLKKINKEDLFIILQRILLGKENVLVNKNFINFLTSVAKKYSLKELQAVDDGMITKKWVDKDEKILNVEMFYRDFIAFYDFKGGFDINSLDFKEINLFDIIMYKQKYSFFLTNIFNNSDFIDEFSIREYLNFYFLANKFRFVEISKHDFLTNENSKNYDKLKLDFTKFLQHEYEKRQDSELKTRVLFMIMMDYFYNFKNAEKMNIGEKDFYCQFVRDLAIFLQDNFDNFNINAKEFVGYLQTNKELNNNLEFYFFETKKVLDEKNHEFLFKDCTVPVKEREKLLKTYYEFYLKLYPNVQMKKKHTPELELGTNIKNLKFNKKLFFRQKERLLI